MLSKQEVGRHCERESCAVKQPKRRNQKAKSFVVLHVNGGGAHLWGGGASVGGVNSMSVGGVAYLGGGMFSRG